MPESSLDAVPMQFQEGLTGEETRRHARARVRVRVFFFAQLKPVRTEELPGRYAVEVVADQREAADGIMGTRVFRRGLCGSIDDFEKDLEREVAEFDHGRAEKEGGIGFWGEKGRMMGSQFKAPAPSQSDGHRVPRDDCSFLE